jgi:hypothetical protein
MSVPIMMSLIREKLGFLSDTKFTNNLLSGEVDIPDDVNDVTAMILREIYRLFLDPAVQSK